MISLLLLKQLHDLGDDQVVEGWIENPYWQLLSGEHELQWSAHEPHVECIAKGKAQKGMNLELKSPLPKHETAELSLAL